MCDNPKTNPWEVLIDPAIARIVIAHTQECALAKGVEYLVQDIPELAKLPREDLKKFAKGGVSEHTAAAPIAEGDLAHIEFDVSRLKKLPEAELRELLQAKLVARIIQDIRKLEINRPIPDWCYAFF